MSRPSPPFVPAFALMLDLCAQVAGAQRAGAATALLLLNAALAAMMPETFPRAAAQPAAAQRPV